MPSSAEVVQLAKDVSASGCGQTDEPTIWALWWRKPCLVLLRIMPSVLGRCWNYEGVHGRMYFRRVISFILWCHMSFYHHLLWRCNWQRNRTRCLHWRNPLLGIERQTQPWVSLSFNLVPEALSSKCDQKQLLFLFLLNLKTPPILGCGRSFLTFRARCVTLHLTSAHPKWETAVSCMIKCLLRF